MPFIQEVATMLFKLYKYDVKSIIRQLLPVWILAPVLSVVFSFACVSSSEEYKGSLIDAGEYFIGDNILPIILGLALFGVFIAITVITLLFIVQRFWRGLLGDEGYLMHTLPVKTGDLIVSKLLSALTIGGISVIDGFISILCMMAVFEGGIPALKFAVDLFFKDIRESLGNSFVPFIIFLILALIVDVIANIYQVYISMAIGQIFGNHRIAASVIVYMCISVALNTISSFGLIFMTALGFEDNISGTIMKFTRPETMINGFIISIVCSAILVVAFHLITSKILKKNLNLV